MVSVWGSSAVGGETVVAAREVHRRAVREMPALVQAHAEHRVAQLEQRRVRAEVGVGAAVGLHVREAGAEEPAGALAREVLHDVHLLAAAVVALARVAFGVLVREHAAHRLHDRRRREVFRRDELNGVALASKLLAQGVGDGRVGIGQIGQSHDGHPFEGGASCFASVDMLAHPQPRWSAGGAGGQKAPLTPLRAP